MQTLRWIWWIALAALVPAGAQAPAAPDGPAPQVVLEEPFNTADRGWLVDDYSRIVDGEYVVDARGTGAFHRWINEPADLRNGTLTVDAQKVRGNNDGPTFGLLLRIQDTWENSYFFVINGAQEYFFGKFVGGQAAIVKQGVSDALRAAGAVNQLRVVMDGTTFGLAANGMPLANVVDETFPSGGRVGVVVETPARVRFDDLVATSTAPVGVPDPVTPPSGVSQFVTETFDDPRGWAQDDVRVVRGGAYHLINTAASGGFWSWHPQATRLEDFVGRVDARLIDGSASTFYGLIWRLRNQEQFYFFLINPSGRFLAGRRGQQVEVFRQGESPAIRTGGEANTLEVRADGSQHHLSINAVPVATFTNDSLPQGGIGVYIEQPGHVAFDNLVVTDLPENAPPVLNAPTTPAPGRWAHGALLAEEALRQAGPAAAWPVDDERFFGPQGYYVRAPEAGSRTVVGADFLAPADGVYTVNAQPVEGPLQSHYGLIVRANEAGDSFYYLLLSATGHYLVGRAVDGQFHRLDEGPVAWLRGGELGNELQIALDGEELRFGVNGQTLGVVRDAMLHEGSVGFYVEHGLTACFRDLRVYELPAD